MLKHTLSNNIVRTIAALLVLLAGLTASAGTTAQDTLISPPDGGDELVVFSPDSAIEFKTQNVTAEAKWVSVQDMPFKRFYQIRSDTRFSAPENMQVHIPVVKPIQKGDVVLISFWMRRPMAGGQPNNAVIYIDAKPKTPGYQYKLSAYRDWKQHVRSFVAGQDFAPSQFVRIHLGEAGKIAEIADLQLINYGPDRDISSLPRSTVMYRGREADAPWRKAALDRIEEIRKSDITVQVMDTQGTPIPDANVRIAMQRHAFGFGNAVDSEVLGADESDFPILYRKKKTITWDDAQKYRQVVKTYFDRVAFASELRPHNWIAMTGGGRSSRQHRILMEKIRPWLLENRIAVRGHYLAWAPMDFNKIEKDFIGNPDGHRAWLWGHMADVLPQTAGFVTEWDTINHIIGWGKHTYEKEYGGPEIYAEILAEARRLSPDVTHTINEGKVLPDGYKREPYMRIIRFLNEQGQPPDMVGFMGHFGLTTLTPPEELLEVYDDFAEIAPRLQLSELDVDAGDDEELQADYFRDVMIATFSHPNFEAIIQWGFWETMHWKPAAALWRDDWTLKPAGEVFVDLVTNQWWTDEELKTDNTGRCRLRGFLGEYEITVEAAGQKKSVTTRLDAEGAVIRVQLPSP